MASKQWNHGEFGEWDKKRARFAKLIMQWKLAPIFWNQSKSVDVRTTAKAIYLVLFVVLDRSFECQEGYQPKGSNLLKTTAVLSPNCSNNDFCCLKESTKKFLGGASLALIFIFGITYVQDTLYFIFIRFVIRFEYLHACILWIQTLLSPFFFVQIQRT